MSDEPPMPTDSGGIAEWLKDPRVMERIHRDRMNAHGSLWPEESRYLQPEKQMSASRRLRIARAYLRRRVRENLTGMDRQVLAEILALGAVLIAALNVMTRPHAYWSIEQINTALASVSTLRQERLLGAFVEEGNRALEVDPTLGQPSSGPAPDYVEEEIEDEESPPEVPGSVGRGSFRM